MLSLIFGLFWYSFFGHPFLSHALTRQSVINPSVYSPFLSIRLDYSHLGFFGMFFTRIRQHWQLHVGVPAPAR